MGHWDVKTVRLGCRRKYRRQVLQLCRCAGVDGWPRMGERGYAVPRMMPVRDDAWDRKLSLSADRITISPEELFTLLNRLYGPVKLFYEWEEGESRSGCYHRLERLFDPDAMRLTQVEYACDYGHHRYLKGNGYAPVRRQIEAVAKENDLPVAWRTDADGALMPARTDAEGDLTPAEEVFVELCREMGEKELAREDRTEPIADTEPDPDAVAVLLEAAEQNDALSAGKTGEATELCKKITALLQERSGLCKANT